MLYSALIHTIAFYIAVQADTCVNGGAGPCLSGLCPVPTMVCIKPDDICCEANQVIAATTVAPVTTAAITTTPGIVTVATTKAPTTTCVDKVNAATGKSDCISMSSYCNNAAYYSLMTDQCPKTCGRCSTSLSTTSTTICVDKVNAATGRSDCTSMASYCSNPVYYALMTEQCPLTCGRCTSLSSATSSPVCVDKINAATGVSDCTKMASYCNDSTYYTLMTEQCPKTCGRCRNISSNTSTSTCVDKVNAATGVSDCATMVSYCTVSSYATLMKEQCPRTCGYCGSR